MVARKKGGSIFDFRSKDEQGSYQYSILPFKVLCSLETARFLLFANHEHRKFFPSHVSSTRTSLANLGVSPPSRNTFPRLDAISLEEELNRLIQIHQH